MSTSGGACFTPRSKVRPEYPPASKILPGCAVALVRVPFLCMLLCFSMASLYHGVVSILLDRGFSEQFVFMALVLTAHSATYVTNNGLFFFIEHYGIFEEYRFERKKFQVPSWDLVRRTVMEAFFGQTILGPPVAYCLYPIFKYFGMPSLLTALPSWPQLFLNFALANTFNDFFFYWSHRIFHCRAMYARVHKQHHTYNGSIGIAAEYASPLEQVFANQLPTVGGCLFFGAHPLVLFIWLVTRLQKTYESHSGYCFYGSLLHRIGLTSSESAAYHDFHHSGNRGNFGAAYMDWAFGTMDAWLELGGTKGYIEKCKKLRQQDSKHDKNM